MTLAERSCIACRKSAPKSELLRIVRTPEGHVEFDETGRKPGRGAYLCGDEACARKAGEKNLIARALRVRLDSVTMDRLMDDHADTVKRRSLHG